MEWVGFIMSQNNKWEYVHSQKWNEDLEWPKHRMSQKWNESKMEWERFEMSQKWNKVVFHRWPKLCTGFDVESEIQILKRNLIHSSLLRTFGFSAISTYDSYLPSIFGKFAIFGGYFQYVCSCRFWGHWGQISKEAAWSSSGILRLKKIKYPALVLCLIVIFQIEMGLNQQLSVKNQYSPLLTSPDFWEVIVDFDPLLAGKWP